MALSISRVVRDAEVVTMALIPYDFSVKSDIRLTRQFMRCTSSLDDLTISF